MNTILIRTICVSSLPFLLMILRAETVVAQTMGPQNAETALRQSLPNNTPLAPVHVSESPVPDETPDEYMQVRLIRNALIALNHANVTGNYTVLRDLCSPGLRKEQTAADFAMTFYEAHDRGRDLSFVMDLKPIPTEQPVLASDGRLRLQGLFPSEPLTLQYDLIFLKTDRGDWWIDGIVINSVPTEAVMERFAPEQLEIPTSSPESSEHAPSSSAYGTLRGPRNPYRP